MISPEAIRQFLNRDLDDHSWMKRLSEAQVDAALARLTPRPKLNGEKLHQKVGFLLGTAFPGFYYVYDMGSGKTRLTIRLLEYHYQTKLLGGWTVILVPTEQAVLGWEDELVKCGSNLPRRLLFGSSDDKWRTLDGFEHGLVIVTYLGFAAMVSELRDAPRSRQKKQKRKRTVLRSLIDIFVEYADGLVMDEITNLGNHQSLSYQAVRPLAFSAKVRYGLAGRPFGRDPTIAWPQFFLVDHGASLGRSLGIFRESFFNKKKRFWGGPHAFEYKLDKKREPDLARAMGHRSLSYDISECVDLPECVATPIKVFLPEENWNYYERLTKSLIAARGNFREVENAFIRMRQITSGFLGFVDDETGERAQVEFKENPKLDAVMAKLAEMPPGRKALIWHEYTWTGARFCRELAKAGIKHGWLWGGTETAEWEKTKKRLENDPEFRVLVISHKKGAFALNLQAANFEFVVESPVSPIGRSQLERRTWRQGQTRTVFRYDVLARGTVDERIMSFLKEGADIFKALVANPQKCLGL